MNDTKILNQVQLKILHQKNNLIIFLKYQIVNFMIFYELNFDLDCSEYQMFCFSCTPALIFPLFHQSLGLFRPN